MQNCSRSLIIIYAMNGEKGLPIGEPFIRWQIFCIRVGFKIKLFKNKISGKGMIISLKNKCYIYLKLWISKLCDNEFYKETSRGIKFRSCGKLKLFNLLIN